MKNLFNVSSPVLIDMINSLFQEDYDPENTEIILTNNEFVLEYDDTEEVGCVSRRLYDKGIITGEDLHGILTALGNLVRYLHSKYGYIKCLIKEVEKMLKTLYDPVVEERGRKKGKKEVALAALKEGYSLDSIMRITGLDEKTILELNKAMGDNQNMSIDTDGEGLD